MICPPPTLAVAKSYHNWLGIFQPIMISPKSYYGPVPGPIAWTGSRTRFLDRPADRLEDRPVDRPADRLADRPATRVSTRVPKKRCHRRDSNPEPLEFKVNVLAHWAMEILEFY